MLRRYAFAALVVFVAILCAPAALVPGFNSADAIVVLAPLALVAVFAHKQPAGDEASPLPSTVPPVESPAGISSERGL